MALTTMNAPRTNDVLPGCIRRFRSDERGNIMLLSGIMAFLIAVLALFIMDTNVAVYDRIVAQNAADGAAETAALWQARGMNLLQDLNTFHYWADWGLFAAESVCLLDCAGTCPAQVAMDACCSVGLIFGCNCPGAIDTFDTVCDICAAASTVNNIQYDVNESVTNLQVAISNLIPVLAFSYADQMAQACGASNLLVVLPNYAATLAEKGSSWLSSLGLPIPTDADLGGLMGGVLRGLDASSLPGIYAFPLQPSSVLLGVSETPGGDLPLHPWAWPSWLSDGASFDYHVIGEPCCFDSGADFEDPTHGWGWSDVYFTGHPGFMTWVAGVSGQRDVALLEKLRWMNPASSDQNGDTNLYNGDYFTSVNPDWIPPVIALASSQVEETEAGNNGLTEHGDADSVPKLIEVYFSPTFPGIQFPLVPIYH
jgi:hypothetical protein